MHQQSPPPPRSALTSHDEVDVGEHPLHLLQLPSVAKVEEVKYPISVDPHRLCRWGQVEEREKERERGEGARGGGDLEGEGTRGGRVSRGEGLEGEGLEGGGDSRVY